MARYPGAIWKPIDEQYTSGLRMVAFNRVNLHVAVSEAVSLWSFFNAQGRASSHFYVRRDGTVEQYVDTAWRAEADLDGNDATISVETQGGLKNADTEPWTAAQVETLARIYAWAVTTHGVPVHMATDAKIGPSSSGMSWHRLGIDGNFPTLPSPLAGRTQRGGGMHYSTARGKRCPGDAKIRQIPDIYARALALLHPEEDDMPLTPADLDAVQASALKGVYALFQQGANRDTPTGRQFGDFVVRILDPLVTARVADVLDETRLAAELVQAGVAGTDPTAVAKAVKAALSNLTATVDFEAH